MVYLKKLLLDEKKEMKNGQTRPDQKTTNETSGKKKAKSNPNQIVTLVLLLLRILY